MGTKMYANRPGLQCFPDAKRGRFAYLGTRNAPQDFTLFLLLNESSVDIWAQKLDWIAKHGGMALVNVHPDYLRFGDEPRRPTTYPAELYENFLEYVRQRYGHSLWNPLPREVASYVKERRKALRKVGSRT